MHNANVKPSSELRSDYADIVRALRQHDHIIITNNGVRESVLIHIDDYAEYEEYLHRRFFHDELNKSKAYVYNHNSELHDAAEVFDRLEQGLGGRRL